MSLLMAMILMGCDPDCGDTSRMDGEYAVWSHSAVTDDLITGTNLDAYPYDKVFVNGWSEWDLKYVPSKKAFQLSIDGQPFEAAYQQDTANCNAFTLSFQGTYATDDNTTHSFTWQGDLAYLGVHLSGTFVYEDAWTDLATGDQGSISIPSGELNATIRSVAVDTGS